MAGGEKLSGESTRAKGICEEIKAAFPDRPCPTQFSRFTEYGDEGERLNHLVEKTWLDMARDVEYLTLHTFSEFISMSEECFLYFFPGYLMGTALHEFVFMDRVINSMLNILSPPQFSDREKELFWYLSDRLTPGQKRVVARWLRLQLEQDKERRSDLYKEGILTGFEIAYNEWRWAE